MEEVAQAFITKQSNCRYSTRAQQVLATGDLFWNLCRTAQVQEWEETFPVVDFSLFVTKNVGISGNQRCFMFMSKVSCLVAMKGPFIFEQKKRGREGIKFKYPLRNCL